jgi:hypothetical protein
MRFGDLILLRACMSKFLRRRNNNPSSSSYYLCRNTSDVFFFVSSRLFSDLSNAIEIIRPVGPLASRACY